MGYGKGGQVFGAEREKFGGPAPEHQALIPGAVGIWAHGSNGLRDEAHDVIGVVVELAKVLGVIRVEMDNQYTFISNRSQMFSIPGEAKNSSRSLNLGIGS